MDTFGVMRCVRDDQSLSNAEKAFLLCAALRANEHGRVKAEQKQLATDAGISLSTAKRIYRSGVLERYFEVRRTGRWVNLIFKSVTEIRSGVTLTPESGATVTPIRCQGEPPSTSLYLKTSTSSSIEELLSQEEQRVALQLADLKSRIS